MQPKAGSGLVCYPSTAKRSIPQHCALKMHSRLNPWDWIVAIANMAIPCVSWPYLDRAQMGTHVVDSSRRSARLLESGIVPESSIEPFEMIARIRWA